MRLAGSVGFHFSLAFYGVAARLAFQIRPQDVGLIRYADDTLLVFECEDDAQRVMRVLPRQLAKFGLRLNAQKTRLVAFGKRAAWRMLNAEQRQTTPQY